MSRAEAAHCESDDNRRTITCLDGQNSPWYFAGSMKIVEVAPRPDFKLFLRFEDGSAGEVDLSSFAGRGVFASWLKEGIFEQVRLTEAGAPEWPGELDLCPDMLYMRLTGKTAEELFPTLRRLPSHA